MRQRQRWAERVLARSLALGAPRRPWPRWRVVLETVRHVLALPPRRS